ncbi:MAG: hypothetical protein Kow00121_25880 [Elainellaceae cyanobacterium]
MLRSLPRYVTKLLILLPLLSSCAPIQLRYFWDEVELNMQVKATDTPGTYAIQGAADLPEKTRIAIAAVRYLHPGNSASARLNDDPTYSILAYQPVEVENGQWQIDLSLWRVAADGRFQEIWQIEQSKLGISLKPDADVVFLATLAPDYELSQLEQELARRGIRFPSGAVLSTSEGFRYAQVQEVMSVALPTGRTTPPPERPEDRNGGWGDRYIIPNEPPNEVELAFPDERKTNAPPTREEFLQ